MGRFFFFLVCLNSQRLTKKSLCQPNQDLRIVPAQLYRPQCDHAPPCRTATGQAGRRKVQGGHLSRADSGVSESKPHIWVMLAQQSPGKKHLKTKEQNNIVLKLVLKYQSCSYQKKRGGVISQTKLTCPQPYTLICSPDPQVTKNSCLQSSGSRRQN